MYFPEDFTADDIMEFEYELNRWIDIERDEGEFWAVNAELAELANEAEAEAAVDRALESVV